MVRVYVSVFEEHDHPSLEQPRRATQNAELSTLHVDLQEVGSVHEVIEAPHRHRKRLDGSA